MITAADFLKYLEIFNVQWGGGSGPISIPVPINQGGTGAITAAGARTNLGLGTIATQAANSVAITGGSATLSTLRAGFVYTNLIGDASLTASQTNEAFNMTASPVNLDADIGIAAFALGFSFNIKNTSGGNNTFTPKAGEFIDGQASLTIHPGEAYTIIRGTTEWLIIASTFGLLGDPIPLSEGGTGANLTANVGGIVYSDADSMEILAGTITAGLPLLSGSSAAPTWGAFALSLGGALTTAGAFEMAGAFTFTGTLTGNTGVTFPTTGTLATLADIPALPLSLANGGTAKSLVAAAGGIVYSDADSFEISAVGSAGQLLQSAGAGAPVWTTATFPATAGTAGNVLTSDGVNWNSSTPAPNNAITGTTFLLIGA